MKADRYWESKTIYRLRFHCIIAILTLSKLQTNALFKRYDVQIGLGTFKRLSYTKARRLVTGFFKHKSNEEIIDYYGIRH